MVVLFHLRATMLPGGYIGVDVFFVISGFLITGQMLREVQATGRLRILEFWARRVRRLLPAAFLVLALSAGAVLLLFPQTRWPQNLHEIAFAAVYLLNFRLAFDSVDYLARDNHPSIAQHYWSLSVEEQFYIVVPLLIVVAVWAARRTLRFNHRQILAAVLVVVWAASFAYSIYDTGVSRSSAYFVTTTRAWEFALGGLVALAPTLPERRWHHPLSWMALGIIITCAFMFNDQTVFPGYVAGIPVGAGALLLWLGDSKDLWAPQWLSHNRFVQVVGDTSYAIYLWHWPLIIVFTQLWGPPKWNAMLGLGAAMLLLSVLTKRYVEDPIRKAPGFLAYRIPTFSLMAAGMAVIASMTVYPAYTVQSAAAAKSVQIQKAALQGRDCFGAAAVMNHCKNPYAWTSTVDPGAALKEAVLDWPVPPECQETMQAGWAEFTCDLHANQAGTASDASQGAGKPQETASPPQAKPAKRVILVGDSHAWHYYPGLARAAQEEHWDLSARIRMACNPFLRDGEHSTDAHIRRCGAFNESVERELTTQVRNATVILALRADPAYALGGNAEYQVKTFTANARSYIEKLVQAGHKVYVVRTIPGMPFTSPREKAPDCVASHAGQNDPCTRKRDVSDWLMQAVAPTPAKLVDPGDLVCSDATCHTVVGGIIVYSDDNHLTRSFTLSMSQWWTRVIQ